MRKEKNLHYLECAKTIAEQSTCLRRRYGCVIVKDDEIVSTGYNGSPRGRINCCDLDYCVREERKIPRGSCYELCRSVHAEQNAIISASRKEMMGATLYLSGIDVNTNKIDANADCCSICKRMIINAGIKEVVILLSENYYRSVPISEWLIFDDTIIVK